MSFFRKKNDSQTAAPQEWCCGSIRYKSLPQLLIVAALMMLSRHAFSAICYILVPTIKPLLLERVGANAALIAIITGTFPSILNFFCVPVISVMSDRTRTRYGRRIPYLFWSAPLLAVTLTLMGFSPEIAAVLQQHFPAVQCNWGLWVLCTTIVLFQIVFLFPSTVFGYLEADVLPKNCLGRYSAIASITSSIMSASINYFLLQRIVDHMTISIPIFGLVYFGIYFLQFLFVKEGEYPPPEKQTEAETPWYRKTGATFVSYFRQCFTLKIYVFLALATGINNASVICRDLFGVLFATSELGIPVGIFGKIWAAGSLISAALVYFFGKLMDRTHPMLIYFIGGVLIMLTSVFSYFFVYTAATYAVFAVITKLMYAFQGLAGLPLMIYLLPRDKFGQYASGNAMVNHVIMIFASLLGGLVTNRFGYRVMFIWDFILTGIAMISLYFVYCEWKRYGGKNYLAPEVK